MSNPPLLEKLQPEEPLYVYLAVSENAVSAVLIWEEDKRQQPIYYVSKTLAAAETRYTELEKLALALVTMTKKLRPYFQAHKVTVLTGYPLKNVLETAKQGRVTIWAYELSEYGIEFKPRTAIKGQVLGDFVAEFTDAQGQEVPPPNGVPHGDDVLNRRTIGAQPDKEHPVGTQPGKGHPVGAQPGKGQPVGVQISERHLTLSGPEPDNTPTPPDVTMTEGEASNAWKLFVDGSSNFNRSGAGLVLTDPKQLSAKYALRFGFKTTNNTAEYEAIIVGLETAKRFGAKCLIIHSDSQLIVNQVKGN